MRRPDIRLLILDELNIALRYEYLPLADVVEALTARRADLHVVVTGRNAKPELIAAADLVTEMTLVKHHFARRGEGASRHRVLNDPRLHGAGNRLERRQIAAGRRASPACSPGAALPCVRSSRRTCRTMPR